MAPTAGKVILLPVLLVLLKDVVRAESGFHELFYTRWESCIKSYRPMLLFRCGSSAVEDVCKYLEPRHWLPVEDVHQLPSYPKCLETSYGNLSFK